MKPILFSSSATTFTTNGIGRLDAISCVVREERNGVYELEMEIAETANHASDIEMSSIIVAIPSQGASAQLFRVYKLSKPINGRFTVYAQHISYQLSYIPTMPFEVTASSSACNQTLQGLKSHAAESCPYTFWTDVPTVASFGLGVPMSIRQALGGVEGSVLDKFGGEYEWDNYTVKLHRYRGVQTPSVSLRYGKNITDLTQEKYISNTVTGICPYWIDSEGNNLVTLTEKVVESQYAQNFPFNRTISLDMSQDFEEKPTEQQLRNVATAYLNQSGVGIPTVSTKVSFVNLTDEEGAALQTVKLCDMVGVYFEKLGISTTAKVVKTEYDVLKERYISIELGSLRSNLVTTIVNTNGAITELQSKMQTKFATLRKAVDDDIEDAVDTATAELEDEIVSATAWLTGSNGYVMAVKNNDGTWKELLFMDTNDVTTAHNVLRINENGLGFSSTGVGGPYTQAWTLDGKLIVGGTNVPSFTVYASDPVAGQSEPSIIFRTSRNGTIWNSANSQMSESGVFTVLADLQPGQQQREIVFKTSKNGIMWNAANSSMDESGNMKINNGTIEIKDANQQTIFKASTAGMLWNAANSSMDVNGNMVINNGTIELKNSNQQTIFKASTAGMLWNAANSSMDVNGNMVINNGTIEIKNSNQQTIFKASTAGMLWNAANSSMDVNGNMTINNGTITITDGSNNILFKASPSGMQWNAPNSQLSESGVFSVYSDDLVPELVFQASKDGIVWDSDNSSMDIYGTLTMSGANIRSSESGARIVMDNTSSIKGYDGAYMHNLINMEQVVSNTHQMTIDADTQLNIRTPALYVTNYSAGTGTATVYETVTATPDYMSDNPDYYMVKDIGKVEATDPDRPQALKELWVQHVDEEDATPDDVYCTLPVYIRYSKTPLKYIHGMLIGKGTTQSVIV